MTAEVSSLMSVMNGYKDDRAAVNETAGGGANSTAMITRDLLGVHHHHHGNSMILSEANDQSQELDLDLEVPSGWEKRLDLKSGKVYLQRCNSAANSPSSSSDQKLNQLSSNQTVQNPRFQDLNVPPNPSRITLNLFDETNLDLKLVSSNSPSSSPSSSSPPANNIYQSVCTLDRVKSALERAEKDQIKKRSSASATVTTSFWKSSMSPSYSSSSSSKKLEVQDEEFEKNLEEERLGMGSCGSPVAAGCPGCLSYVLISRNNPKCPRCNSLVPMPIPKKPRIDLNISI